MWRIFEGPKAWKSLARCPNETRCPNEILKRYEKWREILLISGPPGLRLIRGFNDEALKGGWFGYRSSRLGLQFRVIYRVVKDELWIEVVELNAHDYRMR